MNCTHGLTEIPSRIQHKKEIKTKQKTENDTMPTWSHLGAAEIFFGDDFSLIESSRKSLHRRFPRRLERRSYNAWKQGDVT